MQEKNIGTQQLLYVLELRDRLQSLEQATWNAHRCVSVCAAAGVPTGVRLFVSVNCELSWGVSLSLAFCLAAIKYWNMRLLLIRGSILSSANEEEEEEETEGVAAAWYLY